MKALLHAANHEGLVNVGRRNAFVIHYTVEKDEDRSAIVSVFKDTEEVLTKGELDEVEFYDFVEHIDQSTFLVEAKLPRTAFQFAIRVLEKIHEVTSLSDGDEIGIHVPDGSLLISGVLEVSNGKGIPDLMSELIDEHREDSFDIEF